MPEQLLRTGTWRSSVLVKIRGQLASQLGWTHQGALVATLAVNFPPTQAPERLGAVAAAAEAAGLPELWV